MIRMKSIKRVLILSCVLVLIFSVGGAYATWTYSTGAVSPFEQPLDFKVGDFFWEGSGDLPTEGSIGENHLLLIENLINHSEHGLNKSDSYLNEQISARKKNSWIAGGSRDTLGSMAVTQSEELDELFGLSASKLSFVIQFVDDNTYYLFTTGVYLGERGEINWIGQNSKPGQPTVPIGDYVSPIYKTVVKKSNGTWAAQSTVEGYAVSAWYEESRSNANATQIPSFDPETFKEGTPP